MRFDDLMADHSVTCIRKLKWAPRNTLFLPPVIDGHRGAWCRLVGYDGNAEGVDVEHKIIAAMCRDDEDDWEACEPHESALTDQGRAGEGE